MKTFVLLLLATCLLASRLSAADPCPICKGEVTTVGKIKDDPSNSEKNEWVWNTSPNCGLSLFNDDSLICKRCWFAKDSDKPDAWWVRNTVLPDSFFIPLCAAIRNFPAPPDSANYDQIFFQAKRTDSISFKCKNSPELISQIRKYCDDHHLSISLTELRQGDVHITAKKIDVQQAAPSNGDKHPK